MKILITAFDPFGGEPVNPAWEAVRRLEPPAGAELRRLQLPTVFGLSGDLVCAAMERERPDVLLCVGQAAGRAAITPERVAINVMDAAIPDNAGAQPREEPVVPGGPAAYFSTLPVKALAAAVAAAGAPAEVSNSAGTFVCNALFYRALHAIATGALPVRAGFVHVPCLPEQAERMKKDRPLPAMALDDIVRGLQAGVEFLAF
ncbi:MAG: pyroglutamyl-peptidase I [Oscillospiraceae bacterium]|nr:pyroglutamyl-peptidase I [Oscillospiraceae bacterium]